MKVNLMFRSIESHDFSARVNLASSLSLALLALRKEPDVRALTRAAGKAVVRRGIALRALELAAMDVDVRYENPNDVALLTYLTVLRGADRRLAFMVAASVKRAIGLWWTERYAASILRHPAGHNEHSSKQRTKCIVAAWPKADFDASSIADRSSDSLYVFAAQSWTHLYCIAEQSAAFETGGKGVTEARVCGDTNTALGTGYLLSAYSSSAADQLVYSK